MSFRAISQVASSGTLRQRVAACVAREKQGSDNPLTVADSIMWQVAGEPGWGEAWASAEAANAELPPEDRIDIGWNESVITDGMILSAVQIALGVPTAEEPSVAWTKTHLVGYLRRRGVTLNTKALPTLTKEELVEMIRNLADTP